MRNNNLMEQLRNRVEELVCEYSDNQYDYSVEEYPDLTGQQWFSYCMPSICDNLEVLDNDTIREIVVEVAYRKGMLA